MYEYKRRFSETRTQEEPVSSPRKTSVSAKKIKTTSQMAENTLTFYANLVLWFYIGIFLLAVIGLIIAGSKIEVIIVAILSSLILIFSVMIGWASIKVFVNISVSLKEINAKLPNLNEE